MPIVIYGLYDPRTDELRYIGKTSTSLEGRLWQHINDAKKGMKTYKSSWIKLLLQFGMEPYIKVLGETTEKAWQEDEKAWIAKAKEEGARLTNLTKGGDGLIGFRMSEKNKQKLSEYNKKIGRIPPNWKGRKQSPEHIKKKVDARKAKGNYNHSDETKENISKSRKGKGLGNQGTLGLKHTDETKQKMSEAHTGEKNHFFGQQHSEETKRKMGKARKGKNMGNKNAARK